MQEHIWALALQSPHEGCSPPIQAFLVEEDARAALAVILASDSDSDVKLFKVALWPTAPLAPWYKLAAET